MKQHTGWMDGLLGSIHLSPEHAALASRHLSKIEQKKLFSPEIEHMRTAEGRWFEASVYEMFLDFISTHENGLSGIVLKGADAPRSKRSARLGQNGFFYSRCGDITIRGNGQDLAEFDFLLLDNENRIIFGEVVTSPSDMKEFEIEIEYKKNLLGYLFDQKTVPFLLVSSFDISHYSVVRRLMKAPENANIQTDSCENIKKALRSRPAGMLRRRLPNGKLVNATELPSKRPFDYLKYHESEKSRVFQRISRDDNPRIIPDPQDTTVLVKKILYGSLYPSAVKTLCNEHQILIKGEKLDYRDVSYHFSKVILATDLPGYEPLVYLRSKRKREYLKMVQDKAGNFKFERYTPSKVGFFLWLESLNPSLGSRITTQILEAFSPAVPG